MTVVGTFQDAAIFGKARLRRAMTGAAEESLDKLQELVRERTPVDTGALRRSIKKSGPDRVSADVWRGKVFSRLEYAAAIEYGMSPFHISPKRKRALKWTDSAGQSVFASHVNHPGWQGAHMFQLGDAEFERKHAEDIVERHVQIWLGTVDAGPRTVVF